MTLQSVMKDGVVRSSTHRTQIRQIGIDVQMLYMHGVEWEAVTAVYKDDAKTTVQID
jgi:hypothetical protein